MLTRILRALAVFAAIAPLPLSAETGLRTVEPNAPIIRVRTDASADASLLMAVAYYPARHQPVLHLPTIAMAPNEVVGLGVYGDVNADGTVNILDAQQIARHAAELSVADSTRMADNGDVNDDGSVDIVDAQATARYSIGLEIEGRIGVTIADFFDDFSQGDGNWTFGGGTHSITNEALTMISNVYYQATAESFAFSTHLDIPWVVSGDMTIVSPSSQLTTDNGISVRTNDVGTYAVEHMWLSVRKSTDSVNWIWLWWVPSLENGWLPWDENSYGYSSFVHSDNQTNTLEMSVSSSEQFTLRANDHDLLVNSDAVNEMESWAGIDVSLMVQYLKLRGWTGTTTTWDNIFFNSETSDLVAVQETTPSTYPSADYVDGILDRIAQGDDVTLKSLLRKRLEH